MKILLLVLPFAAALRTPSLTPRRLAIGRVPAAFASADAEIVAAQAPEIGAIDFGQVCTTTPLLEAWR